MAENNRAVKNLLVDNLFYTELREFLEKAIDEELIKPESEMDCELIDECAEMLINLEACDDKSKTLAAFVSSKKIIRLASSKAKNGKLGKGLSAAIAAVLALITVFGTNAAIEKSSGINYIAEIGNAITAKLEEWGILRLDDNDSEAESTGANDENNISEEGSELTSDIISDEESQEKENGNNDKPDNGEETDSESSENSVVALRLSFAESFKTEYLFGEELNLTGMTVIAVYADSSTDEVPVSECSVSGYNRMQEGTQKVLIKYQNAGASFDVNVKKTSGASQRVVTGVDGNPPTKVVYTTADTKLSLDGINLRLVYSDGTYSPYYTRSSISIVKDADFTQIGNQTVTVRVANLADYSFEITVERAVTDSDIERIEFGPLSGTLSLNVGDDIFLSDYYINIYYKKVSADEKQRVDTVYLRDIEYKVSIYNLDTSTDTLSAKTFTLGYKGQFTTVKYTVSYKRHIQSVDIINGDFKRIYYKGESFCYDKGSQADSALKSLESYKLNFSGYENQAVLEQLFRGSSPKIRITYIEDASETISFSACSYSGYDPYKEGYQKIDIYHKGMYLTSYIIFVYGNNCYVPISVANYELKDSKNLVKSTIAVANGGSTAEYSNINYFLKAQGSVVVGQEKYSCLRYLSKVGLYGKLTAYAELPDGTVYSYEVYNRKTVVKAEIRSSSDTPKINLNSLEAYDFGNDRLILTFSDNTSEIVPLNSAEKVYAFINSNNSSVQPMTSMTQIDSAYGYIYFTAGNGKYEMSPVSMRVYFYR